MMGVFQNVMKVVIHERLAASEGNTFSALLAEIGENTVPFLFG